MKELYERVGCIFVYMENRLISYVINLNKIKD